VHTPFNKVFCNRKHRAWANQWENHYCRKK